MKVDASFAEVVSFHGHSCPGLALGYRAAKAAIEALGLQRAKDEELVAIVENDACGVDAFQYLLGCTFGKGNLIFMDWGKHAFTVISRSSQKAVRVVADFPWDESADQEEISDILQKIRSGSATKEETAKWKKYKTAKAAKVLETPADEFLKIQQVEPDCPPKAKIADSVHCSLCGEKVMVTKTNKKNALTLCIPCSQISETP